MSTEKRITCQNNPALRVRPIGTLIGFLLVISVSLSGGKLAFGQVYITDTQVQNGGVFDVNPPDGEAIVISHVGTDASLSLINGATTNGVHGVVVGLSSGEQGTLLIDGGSVLSNMEPWWTNSWVFEDLNFFAGSAGIGIGSGSTGYATVSGNGSAWNNSGELGIGFGGTGYLNVLSGGNVTSDNGYLGFFAGASGTATLNNATWSNDQTLYVGYEGTGELNILNGGSVTSIWGILGYANDGVGTVNVSSGGSWTMSGEFHLGYWGPGSGTLNITDGGTVSNTNGYISNFSSAVIDGSGSTWTNSGDLFVGYNSGDLSITNGGLVSNTNGYVAATAGSTASVALSGNSTWNNSGALWVGSGGQAEVNIGGGSTVTNTDGYVGYTGTSTVNLSGGSNWTNDGVIYIGYVEHGVLSVEGSSNVTSTGASVGYWGTGAASFSGGSTWINSGDLYVGGLFGGVGTLNIEGGSSVTSSTSSIDNGSSVTITGAGSTWTNNGVIYSSGTLIVNDGGLVDVGVGLNVYGHLTGDGGTILGNVAIQNGLLTGNNMTIIGDVYMNFGIIAPGNSTGILTIDGNLVSSGEMEFQLGGLLAGTGYDQLNVLGDVTLNSPFNSPLLSVSAWNGFELDFNQSFDILTVGGTLSGFFRDEFWNQLNDGDLVTTLNGVDLFISYHSNGVTLFTAIPEPSSLMIVGLAFLFGFSRRVRCNGNRLLDNSSIILD
ncbi:MAG TPA: PEP-CTERM sorting domain-containing protein [Pirellulaceae bacterium]|nr:PEP-CTERM sorting domain-containing protein [Pirellulaceae bacterium]HMO93641.1 PEP-CTERM sorting domain-containing protein [Pirellulaceae bacterium]HMP71401.1 PEP-CTERM sorting domain-containing protein [Pirellulaceae bacterium]